MGPAGLLSWQWQNYPANHTTRANLLIHICTAPFFWAGTVLLVTALLSLSWPLLVLGAACILATLIAQGRGHKLEPMPPARFTSPWNFVARLFLEQWITFPRFVLSGAWYRNFSRAP